MIIVSVLLFKKSVEPFIIHLKFKFRDIFTIFKDFFLGGGG